MLIGALSVLEEVDIRLSQARSMDLNLLSS